MADRSKSLIYSLYKAFNGKAYQQSAKTKQGMFDPQTGTFYCGKDASLPYYMNEDAKRYLASRYHDYKNARVDENGHLLSKEELEANLHRADAILGVMKAFDIPVAEFL